MGCNQLDDALTLSGVAGMESDATASYHPQRAREKRVLESIMERLDMNDQMEEVFICGGTKLLSTKDVTNIPRMGELVVVNEVTYRVDWITHNFDKNRIEVTLVVFP